MALPANVNYCTVTGRFISAVADSADPGKEPDGVPVAGLQVQFAASFNPPVVKNAADAVSILITPITCTTDSQGYLLGPDGTRGVMLVASDDPDLDPHGWTWTATVSGTTFPRVSTSFVAPSGGTVDLTTVLPVPASPGTAVAQWQAAVAQTLAVRDEVVQLLADFDPGEGASGASGYEVAVQNGFVGDEAAWLASLQGDPGTPGAPGAPGEDGAPGVGAVFVNSLSEIPPGTPVDTLVVVRSA